MTKKEKRQYDRRRYLANREQIRQQQNEHRRSWTKGQKQEAVEYHREWRRRNREKLRVYDAAYRATHKKLLHAIKRRWYYSDLPKHRRMAAEKARQYRKRHAELVEAKRRQRRSNFKEQARLALQRAVHGGRVRKPSSCERCGEKMPKRLLHGHHPNYAKPLTVVWLCPVCHTAEHRKGR